MRVLRAQKTALNAPAIIFPVVVATFTTIFFINSNIHPAILNKQEQLDLQYPLLHRDYEFLKYDSFLCASAVIERKLSDIAEGIKNGTTSIIGRLKEEHIVEVLEMVRASRVINDRHKKLFFY